MTSAETGALVAALRSPHAPEWEPLLGRVLAGEGVGAVFQPIIDLSRMTVTGYEALARFEGPAGLTPDRWFASAAVRNTTANLDAIVLRTVLSRRRELPPNCFLTVNLEPESLLSPTVLDTFAAETTLRGVVVEITEHRPIADPVAATRALGWLRERGALIALDDAGAGYAGLHQILLLRPSFLKVDRSLVDGVDRDEAKVALLEMLGVFASRIDAWLLAEGVETEAESRRLSDLGIPLAQGYFYGRPAPPWSPLSVAARDALGEPTSGRRRGTLHELIEVVPWVSIDESVGADERLGRSLSGMLVVLDGDLRPVTLLVRDAVGPQPAPFVANVNSTVRELAHRLATHRHPVAAAPVLVTDNAGRYVGVITLPRLLAALAAH